MFGAAEQGENSARLINKLPVICRDTDDDELGCSLGDNKDMSHELLINYLRLRMS